MKQKNGKTTPHGNERAPQDDIEATKEKAAKLYSGPLPTADLTELTNTANVHPTPTHEPAMPAEVYYNKMALDGDYDLPDGPGKK